MPKSVKKRSSSPKRKRPTTFSFTLDIEDDDDDDGVMDGIGDYEVAEGTRIYDFLKDIAPVGYNLEYLARLTAELYAPDKETLLSRVDISPDGAKFDYVEHHGMYLRVLPPSASNLPPRLGPIWVDLSKFKH